MHGIGNMYVPVTNCYITNYSKILWLKITAILFCLQILWVRNLDRACMNSLSLLHNVFDLSWENLEGGGDSIIEGCNYLQPPSLTGLGSHEWKTGAVNQSTYVWLCHDAWLLPTMAASESANFMCVISGLHTWVFQQVALFVWFFMVKPGQSHFNLWLQAVKGLPRFKEKGIRSSSWCGE